jgi:hypothetical protein
MATICGYKAVLLAADRLPKVFPMLTTAAGTITLKPEMARRNRLGRPVPKSSGIGTPASAAVPRCC